MTIDGVRKPSYRALELLHQLGEELVTPVDGIHPTLDAWVVRDRRRRRLAVVITNHTYPGHEIVTERALIHLDTSRRLKSAQLARIDDDNANPKGAWIGMGGPQYPTARQLDALHDASSLRLRKFNPRV